MSNYPENQTSEPGKSRDAKAPSQKDGGSSRRSRSSRGQNTFHIDRGTADALKRSTVGNIAPTGGRELNFFDVIGILERQIWIVIFAAVVGVVGAGYAYTTQKKEFAASSTIYIPANNAMSILNGVDRSANGSAVSNLRNDKIETHAIIIKSQQILLDSWKAIIGEQKYSEMLLTESLVAARDNEDEMKAVDELVKMVTVRVGGDQRDFKDANTITIRCVSCNPEEAAMIVNTIVNQYELYFDSKYNRTNNDVQNALEKQKAKIEEEIAVNKKDLFDYITAHTDSKFLGSDDNNPLLTALIKMSENKVDIDFHLIKLQNRLESLTISLAGREPSEVSEAELIAMMTGGDDDGIMEQLFAAARGSSDEETVRVTSVITVTEQVAANRLTDLRQKLVELENRYGRDHASVESLKKQIAEAEAEYEKVRQETNSEIGKIGIVSYSQLFESYQNAISRRVNELKEEQSKIISYVDAQRDQVGEIIEYREQLEAKKLSIESLKMMQERFVQSLEQLKLVSNVNAYQLEVLTKAEPKPIPVYPNLFKFIFVGLVLGLVAGVAIAYLIDVSDATFHTPSEIVRYLRMPIIVQMPSMSGVLKGMTDKAVKSAIAKGEPHPALIALHKPNDPFCEIFRQVRTRIFNQRKGTGCIVVMGTSPHPTDGKSMFLSNLAIKIAESGKRVLLMDCDMRKPDMHKWFGIEIGEGVSNVLVGEKTIEEVLRPSPVANLSLMTAGNKRKRTGELIADASFEQLFIELREMFDVILVDTPPVLYVNDASSIAPRMDGVLYIFRVRRRGRPDVVTGVKSLVDVGANMLGCIVNLHDKCTYYNESATAEETSSEYGYGSGYGGGYGYGSGYGGGYGYGTGYGGGYGYGAGYGGGYGYGAGYGGGYGYGAGYGGGYGYGAGYGYGYGNNYGNGYGDSDSDGSESGGTESGDSKSKK